MSLAGSGSIFVMAKMLNLGQCADRNVDIEVLCTGCLRRKTVSARLLAGKFGAETVPPNLNGKLKCGVCSSTRCEVRAVQP
jgi:hypothetical protein